MKVAVFVTIWSAGMPSSEIHDLFLHEQLAYLKSEPAVESVEFYTPEPGDVPKIDDIPTPDLIVQIDVDSASAAENMVSSEKFVKLFLDQTEYPVEIDKINLEVLEPVHYPLPGQTEPAPRTAPLSFVVRYYGPVKDTAQFVDFYTENHPPILAKFPEIRNVLCYLPLDRNERGESGENQIVIGNEVVFDDLESFKHALSTDVLQEAMADSELFQPYGYSSHHAMHRDFVYQR